MATTQSRSIYRTVPVAGALLLAVWAGAGLPKAHACSSPAPAPDFGWGEPADNTQNVPTDVILYYPIPIAALSNDGVPGTFTLKTMAAVEVAVTARRVHYWNYELVPAEELSPNTAYELTGSWRLIARLSTWQPTSRHHWPWQTASML